MHARSSINFSIVLDGSINFGYNSAEPDTLAGSESEEYMTVPKHQEPERLLTVEDVAERLGMTQETVRRWLRKGDLRGVRLAKRLGWRIRERDLEAFIEDHLTGGSHAE